ncbi:hypothetical protein HHI36_018816 [Cryptolaemus montrouzieri]|uniref:P21-activated protein kinase-interacting protein 1-like n=1 Tax=Cryptolaemus montrouzieri TaxID=559131 RepID=A0ABD2P118_9CUCU
MNMNSAYDFDFEIIAGTYEEFLIGYLCSIKENSVKQSFASHDHTSSIRTVAYSDQYLASGSADDRIIIYDLTTRKECNMLVHHSGTITCLQFTNEGRHLISGSSDGLLVITRVGNWQVEKIWDKAHKGLGIFDVAIHPSGKLALTLGADTTLRTWNLVKGRQAYAINLNSKSKDAKSLEKIVWDPDGIYFILYGGKYTEIWNIEDGGIFKFVKHDEKVTSCIWLNNDKILVGHENGQITVVTLEDCSKFSKIAHSSRVKSLAKYKDWIVSISSNGQFKIWSETLSELLMENTGCRPTCLCVVPTLKVKKEEITLEEEKEEEIIPNNVKPRVIITEDSDEVESEEEKQTQKRPKKKRKN